MFKITKEFHFEYGHRVWTQVLDKELSCNSQCACRHLHGHSGIITLELQAEQTSRAMVLDFKNLEFFKKFIDHTLDHKFIVDMNDPWFQDLLHKNPSWIITPDDGGFFATITAPTSLPEWNTEVAQGFLIVSFVPTSEMLSQWMCQIANFLLQGIASVSSLTWKETAKTTATYIP
jgi:6-pyruvoyltetrahydropterin/6-carboxytetrahydropterin synthase